jgi:hypothetical protein
MAVPFDTGIFSVLDSGSAVLPGAKLFFYTTGTSAKLATYSDRALATPNANPVVADANGRFGPIWLQPADYKVVLTTSADTDPPTSPLVTSDPVPGTSLYTTTYAPTVTAIAGSITTKSATSRYSRIGNTVHFQAVVTVTTNGTGATAVRITLPIAAVAPAVLAGRQTTGGSGLMLQGIISGSVLDITTYANLYPAADGVVLTVSGSYEVA